MKIIELHDIAEVELLLSGSSLPASDLKSNDNIQLFGTYQNNKLMACIGVEIYSDSALVRSLIVDQKFRNKGVGKKFLGFFQTYCIQNNVNVVFFLTETSEKYLEKLGFKKCNRKNAPLSIKGTTQFSALCPSSSSFMKKILNG
jgi:amino-acid N-acetyltransferase